MNPKVDTYLSKLDKWQKEIEQLRAIILDCGLSEELKWSVPIYTFQNSNVVGINGLKDCCALGFFKGSLLHDADGILAKPGENTQSARVVRFTNVKEIVKMAPILKAYIYEAIEVEKAGLKADFKQSKELVLPGELQKRLDESPDLKTAFEALTLGRQRAYVLHFSAPKQPKTRESRIEKYIPQILKGKGMNDD